ncbi:MAG: trypsin-like peptidase domain-containing protein [Bacillota bacterium]|nr:trypsin-like peptidase domain-containing protein [Bacillota bacterium]
MTIRENPDENTQPGTGGPGSDTPDRQEEVRREGPRDEAREGAGPEGDSPVAAAPGPEGPPHRVPDYGRGWDGSPPRHQQRNSLMSYLMVAIVGALIGGLLVTAAVPSLYGGGFIGRNLEAPKLPVPAPSPAPATGAPGDSPAVAVAARLGPAVVGITNRLTSRDLFGRQTAREASGSGVIFAKNGYIVTNNHVVEGARELVVALGDGRTFPAVIVGTDKPTDLAVIKIETDGLPAAEFGNSDELRVGEFAVAIGNPVATEFQRSVTQGIISGLNRVLRVGDESLTLIQTDAVINPGNSGGTLSNARGQVIGINTLKIDLPRVEGMGFAIPINTARPIIEALISTGRVQRAWIGVYLIDKTNAAQFNLKVDHGAYIAELVPGGPAEKAGLKVADVIVAIGQANVVTVNDLKAALRKHKVGERVEVAVERGGNKVKVPVVLAEAPAEQPQPRRTTP